MNNEEITDIAVLNKKYDAYKDKNGKKAIALKQRIQIHELFLKHSKP